MWAWGDNAFGELGDGSITPATTPQQLPAFSTAAIKQVAAGNGFSLALDARGTVWAWGNDSYGQLGNNTYGTGHEEATPVIVSGFNGVPIQAIAAGADFALALDANGNVWAWGGDASGQLGALAVFQCGGSTLSPIGCTPTPSKVLSFPTPVTITAIAAGGDHSLALDAGGQVWAWGNDASSQLGIPPPTASPCGLLGLLGACSFAPVPCRRAPFD